MASSLVVHLIGKAGGLMKTLTKGTQLVNGFSSRIAGLASPIMSLVGPLAAVASVGTAIGLATWGVQLAAQAETAQAQFATLLKSEDKARDLLSQITQFAASTPFQDADLKSSARQLLAAGTALDQVIPSMKVLGDISAGSGKDLGELTAIYAKIRGAGKLTGESLNQLAEAGIPIRTQLAQSLGVAESEIAGLVSASKIGFGTVQQALLDMTSGSGLFAGGMEKQSQTIEGLWSTLKDNASLVFRDIGAVIIEEFDFKGALANATTFAQTFKADWLPSIRGTIHAVAETFNGTVILLQEAWNGWLGDSVGAVTWAVGNWDLLWQVGYQQVLLFATNSLTRIQTFATNAGELAMWFAGNWQDVWLTLWRFQISLVTNMATNLHQFFVQVTTWLAGGGFDFKWTGLLDGFESTLKELPKLTKAAIQETTPELERLYAELGKREAEANQMGRDAIADSTLPEPSAFQVTDSPVTAAGKKSGQKKGLSGALEQGSKEAYSAIVQAGQKPNGPEQKTAKNTEKAATTLKDMARSIQQIEHFGLKPIPPVVTI